MRRGGRAAILLQNRRPFFCLTPVIWYNGSGNRHDAPTKGTLLDEDRIPTNFRMTRLVRTQTSEIYLIWEDERRIGQLDLHYAHDTVHGTLILEGDLSLEQEEGLIAQIDDDIVQAYLPSFDREDFLVTVFRGEEISHYTDTSGAMDDLDDDE